jgi:hypothetical protein
MQPRPPGKKRAEVLSSGVSVPKERRKGDSLIFLLAKKANLNPLQVWFIGLGVDDIF